MNCKICGNEKSEVIYDDFIRDGAPGMMTKEKYKMYQCTKCGTIWHDNGASNDDYYQTKEYREKVDNASSLEDYYRMHDSEILDKFNYCGTEIFRNATVADIGCGGGGFLDYIFGPADEIIAIEPSIEYRKSLIQRGFRTYSYAAEAINEWKSKVDVVTSFDVIEHVDDPIQFMRDAFNLLKPGGKAIIGTPTDCPFMRKLLGHDYEQGVLYSYQHIWILSNEGFKIACEQAGFQKVKVRQVQRYGLANAMSWLKLRKPCGHIDCEFISSTLDECYRRELENQNMADYVIAYVEK